MESNGMIRLWNEAIKKQVKISRVSRILVFLMLINSSWQNPDECIDRAERQSCEAHYFFCECEGSNYINWMFRCLEPDKICDSFDHCKNREDENKTLCTASRKCPPNYRKCDDKMQCIKAEQFCDGSRDCWDDSDEPKGCIEKCPEFHQRCDDAKKCVLKEKYCIGKSEPECADGSDEDPEKCKAWECVSGDWKCDSPSNDAPATQCVPNYKKCDGEWDCLNKLDEAECSSCPDGALQCYPSTCVPKAHICDGHFDCKNGDDENEFGICKDKGDEKGGEEEQSGTGMLKTPITLIVVSVAMASYF